MDKTPDETLREISRIPDYEEESKHNLAVFLEFLKKARPDVWVLMDLLDRTKINYYVLFQIIKVLNNIAMVNKYGTVTIQIENGIVTFVRGEESVRVSEPLTKDSAENESIDNQEPAR